MAEYGEISFYHTKLLTYELAESTLKTFYGTLTI